MFEFRGSVDSPRRAGGPSAPCTLCPEAVRLQTLIEPETTPTMRFGRVLLAFGEIEISSPTYQTARIKENITQSFWGGSWRSRNIR